MTLQKTEPDLPANVGGSPVEEWVSNNPTVTRTNPTLHKVNQDEKAESYIPDEGTR